MAVLRRGERRLSNAQAQRQNTTNTVACGGAGAAVRVGGWGADM